MKIKKVPDTLNFPSKILDGAQVVGSKDTITNTWRRYWFGGPDYQYTEGQVRIQYQKK